MRLRHPELSNKGSALNDPLPANWGSPDPDRASQNRPVADIKVRSSLCNAKHRLRA
jgi:hypothetical protein